jgi:hypothetical protein
MSLPFKRQNDADGLTNQEIMDNAATSDYGSNILDGGLLNDANAGPIISSPHHFTAVAATDISATTNGQSGQPMYSTPNNANNLNAGIGVGDMEILTEEDSSLPMADIGSAGPQGGTSGGSGSSDLCPKGNCLLWAAAGLFIGKRFL